MRRNIIRTVALLLSIASPIGSIASGQDSNPHLDHLVRSSLDLADFQLQTLDVPPNDRRPFTLEVRLDGAPVHVELAPTSVRAPGFRVVADHGSDRFIDQPLPAETTYRGRIPERPRAMVAASVLERGLTARIVDGDQVWAIQPLADVDPDAARDAYVVYRAADMIPGDWLCVEDVATPAAFDSGEQRAAAPSGSSCQNIAEVAFDADVEYYLLNGSSIPNVVADIESVMNGVNVIYERDVFITHLIPRIVVRIAEPDGLDSTDSATLLSQFRTKWNAEHSPGSADPIDRDTAHLMTGKEIDSTVIGRAYLSVICSDLTNGSGYGFSQSRFTSNYAARVALTAHELGHNWSANHCNGDGDCAIMCSGLGGCSGVIDQFGSAAISSISSYRDTRSCLDHEEPPALDCNNNCVDDTMELSMGLAPDCNGNNIIDSCDIADGLSGDCDLNGVPDICEDCNGNGLADACDLASAFDDDSGPLSPFGFFTDVTHTIVAPPLAVGDVNLEFEALGYLNFGSDNIDVSINGSTPFTIFDVNGTDCPAVSGPELVVLSATDFNNLVNGGNAVFSFHTEAQFLPDDCGGAWVSVKTSFTATNPDDANQNGILDICECDEDCGSAGPDTLVNVSDLLDLLANWGTSPSSCDIAPPGGDGVVDVGDLLALLAAWGGCAP